MGRANHSVIDCASFNKTAHKEKFSSRVPVRILLRTLCNREVAENGAILYRTETRWPALRWILNPMFPLLRSSSLLIVLVATTALAPAAASAQAVTAVLPHGRDI